MRFPLLGFMTKSVTTRLLVLVFAGMSLALSVSAQKNGSRLLSPEAIGIDIEQCANGPIANPNRCNVALGNDGWARGNVNESKSHYKEGEFVPIRLIATGLTVNQQYTVTLGYDFTKGGKYATDYIGDYDETENVLNLPCTGVPGCQPGPTLFPILADPEVAAGFDKISGTADDIVQTPGSFACFGCTIVPGGVSPYTRIGATTGNSSKQFTITFIANAETIVIAYGAHISTRFDWGLLNSAVNISGSPYHNFVVDFPGANGGSRDLQLSASAVIFPAFIVIEKTVVTPTLQTSGGQSFGFSSSATIWPVPSSTFSLVDDVPEPYGDPLLGHPFADRRGGTITSAGIELFGATNAITVTEPTLPTGWSLVGITCVSGVGVNNNTINLGARTVSIVLEEGEVAVCSFHNSLVTPTAAPASISGRAVDSFGNGIGGARVTVVDAQTGDTHVAITSPFGYYTIDGTEVDNFYIMTISHKRYTFADDTRSFTLLDNLVGVDFVANP